MMEGLLVPTAARAGETMADLSSEIRAGPSAHAAPYQAKHAETNGFAGKTDQSTAL
jgi:hypothetical protein